MYKIEKDFYLFNKWDVSYADKCSRLTSDVVEAKNVLRQVIQDNCIEENYVFGECGPMFTFEIDEGNYMRVIADSNKAKGEHQLDLITIEECRWTVNNPERDGFCLVAVVDESSKGKIVLEGI